MIALMRASTFWDQFRRSLQRALPKYGTTLELSMDILGCIVFMGVPVVVGIVVLVVASLW